MSKKNKAKFKKHLKQQILQEIQQEEKKETPIASPEIQIKNPVPITVADSNIADSNNYAIYNLPQIKYDLKKTGIVVLGLAIIIGSLYFLDQKYNLLINFGDWLFKVFNIN